MKKRETNELTEFLRGDSHHAPVGFEVRMLHYCEMERIDSVAGLLEAFERNNVKYGFPRGLQFEPNIGRKTNSHLQRLIDKRICGKHETLDNWFVTEDVT